MLSPDQITAIAPDAASLKAGRGLATSRKWQTLGGDDDVIWGLAIGSGKDPYQTRVSLSDFASKCSCPSRKFPCKHALGLMFIATGEPAALAQTERPDWVIEWIEARAAREEKRMAKAATTDPKPVDTKAAEKRHAQRQNRMDDGVALLQQALCDLAREGFAAATARDGSTWENLARRMVDAQAPGLARQLRHITDTVLRDSDVDDELPLEAGRLHLLLHTWATAERQDEVTRAELRTQFGGRSHPDEAASDETIADVWFVAGRRLVERDRLLTSSTWLFGERSHRWARILRFASVPQTIVEPWPVGSKVETVLTFSSGLYPRRATPESDGIATPALPDRPHETALDCLLDRFAAALASNPFLRTIPFLIPLFPASNGRLLADESDRGLPWQAKDEEKLLVECICGGRPATMCGEWDGRYLRLLAILDGDTWTTFTALQQ